MLPTEHRQAKLSQSGAKASLVLVLTLNRLFLSSRCSHSRERVGWGSSGSTQIQPRIVQTMSTFKGCSCKQKPKQWKIQRA